MRKILGYAWNVVRALIALFVLYFAYRCTQITGMADRPEASSAAMERMADRLAAAPVPAPPAPPECSPGAFTVKGARFRREYDTLRFTARVTNAGANACGVQLKVSTYDKAGGVLDSEDFWPASIRNIQPGASENFSYFIRFDKAAATYDLVAIDARRWRPR